MRRGAVLVHAPGLAASRAEEAAGKAGPLPLGEQGHRRCPSMWKGKGYRVGQLDAAWTQGAPSPPAPAPPLATARSEGLTPIRALPPAPALQPLKLPCPHRCATPDADPPARAGLGPLCLGVKPHCPPFSAVLLTPGQQAGWKGSRPVILHWLVLPTVKLEPHVFLLACTGHKDLLYSDFSLLWWPHTYTCVCARTHSPGSSVTLAPVGRGSSPSSETPLPSQALQPDVLPPPSIPAQRRT